MKILQAPNELNLAGKHSIFLAGGISNCEDWQSELISMLNEKFGDEVVIINPRRKDYHDSEEIAVEQIKWEHKYIAMSNEIVFWFCPPTTNPITLFEFGKELGRRERNVYLGIHPDYSRKLDVITQCSLESVNYTEIEKYLSFGKERFYASSLEELVEMLITNRYDYLLR